MHAVHARRRELPVAEAFEHDLALAWQSRARPAAA